MKRSLAALLAAFLILPGLSAKEPQQQRSVAVKRVTPAKPAGSSAKPEPLPVKRTYAELSIGELVNEDANRWSDKMSAYASVGGFVTNVARNQDGDIDIRVCDNPKVDGMDRARCVVAKCIPRIPCDVPQVGKPVTVKGITRYDAKVGTHWWEIHPVEQIDK